SVATPRSLTTTFAPYAASRVASARPIPRPLPVTTATLPSSICRSSAMAWFFPPLRACRRARPYRAVGGTGHVQRAVQLAVEDRRRHRDPGRRAARRLPCQRLLPACDSGAGRAACPVAEAVGNR